MKELHVYLYELQLEQNISECKNSPLEGRAQIKTAAIEGLASARFSK